jgi:hypothetical protein
MMCAAIDNHSSCEICAVIDFLHTKNIECCRNHHELHAVDDKNIMSEGTGRHYCRLFNDGQRNEQMFTVKNEVVSRL